LLTVLHVEDDDNDAVLLAKACQRAGLPMKLHRVANGAAAQAYLLREPPFDDPVISPRPQVIVLDLKLPGMDGFEFLRWLRPRSEFAGIPVLVFTASLSRDDKARALAEGASSYFVKPASFDALLELVERFRIGQGPEMN
jgi:DNA-binding response OmpR family regulator